MNNLPVRAKESPFHEVSSPRTSYPTETKVISTVALLVLGYYVLSFLDAWPSTINRSAYESFVYLFPSHLLSAIQHGMVRLGFLDPDQARFTRANYGDMFAKEEAFRRIIGQPQIPFALRKVRSLSGVGGYISLSNDVGPPGLGNWDNSCYQNSVLQGLASLPAFIEFVEHSLQLCDRNQVPAATHRALLVFLEQLASPSGRKTTLWTPSVLKSMDSWQQQDAQEYFSRLLDAVEKEANAYIKLTKRSATAGLECLKKVKTHHQHVAPGIAEDLSAASQIQKVEMEESADLLQLDLRNPVDGMTAQGLECKTCGFTEGLSLTHFNCLTLNLGLRGPSDLEDLLDEYTAPEEVEGVECENCTKLAKGDADQKAGDASASEAPGVESKKSKSPVLRTKAKQITVGRLPKDLVFHINRSIFDEYGNQQKNTASVSVPAKLDFLRRWCVPLDEDDDSSEAVYELKCVVTHFGRHDNGHYVALGKRGKDWYSFNDEFVTKITEDEVLRRGNGFMLFYEVIPSRQQSSVEKEQVAATTDSVGNFEDCTSEPKHNTMDLSTSYSEDSSDFGPPDANITMTPSTAGSEASGLASEPSSPTDLLTKAPVSQDDILSLPTKTATEVHLHAHEQPSSGGHALSAL